MHFKRGNCNIVIDKNFSSSLKTQNVPHLSVTSGDTVSRLFSFKMSNRPKINRECICSRRHCSDTEIENVYLVWVYLTSRSIVMIVQLTAKMMTTPSLGDDDEKDEDNNYSNFESSWWRIWLDPNHSKLMHAVTFALSIWSSQAEPIKPNISMVEQYSANTYMFENGQIAKLSFCALRDATPYQFCRLF